MNLTGGTRNFESDLHVHGNMHCVSLTVDELFDLAGNIETASALETARTISLSGDVTGSVLFDGSADVDIIVTSAIDVSDTYYSKVELDNGQLDSRYYTETEIDTLNYTKSELNAGQLDNRYYTETEIDNTFLPLTGGTISTDLTITGDLTINGTTNSINTEELVIEDNLIIINSNQTGTPPTLLKSGIEVERGDSTNYHFLFREFDDTFVVGEDGFEQAVATREDTPTAFGLTYWDSANISLQTLDAGTAGMILTSGGASAPSWELLPDATVVDATPLISGIVNITTQSFGGDKTFASTTESVSSVTGALISSGGIAAAKNITAGGSFNLGISANIEWNAVTSSIDFVIN